MIEPVLYKLIKESNIANDLCSYNGEPAIFYQTVPNDRDEGWNDERMFPRLTFGVDWSYDVERNTSGVLMIDVFCLDDSEKDEPVPEYFAHELEKLLSNVFMTSDNKTYCAVWDRTDPFELQGSNPRVCGVTITFGMVQLSPNRTMYPDPVVYLQDYIKQYCEVSGKVFEIDELEEVYTPTDDEPLFYVRLTSNSAGLRDKHEVTKLQAGLAVHIFTQSATKRLWWMQYLMNCMASSEYSFSDPVNNTGSRYQFMSIQSNVNGDPMRSGQITVSMGYDIAPVREEGERLNDINISRGGNNGY